MNVTVVMGKQGRIVIPSSMREALSLEPGDQLHISTVGSVLRVQAQRDAVEEVHGMLSRMAPERSLVDELIAERRRAAAAE